MSGKKYKLLRQEARKRGFPYKLVKRAYKRMNAQEKKILLTQPEKI